MSEIIKTKLINKYLNDTLIGSSKLKKPIDWSKILLTIIAIFESL